MNELELRQAIKDAGVELVKSNLVQGTWGNISVRLDKKHMLVTPSGLDYIMLRPEDMVKVNIETLEYEGHVKPTSERKIHAAIYRERDDINAVIHSHPFYSSSMACARHQLPVISSDMLKMVLGDVRVGSYGMPSTAKLTKGTLTALKGRNACFMANHGIVACYSDLDGAFKVCKLIEDLSRVFIERETLRYTGKETFSQSDLITVFRNRKKYKLKSINGGLN
ncbi:MAG: class II aldolase/adducin family protein [Christensenellaceae bacterium]|jgi:L-fuculose-phosphate aldolase|nr:class II aldolase/adducin family protein [Christensenellaceae bacterium]